MKFLRAWLLTGIFLLNATLSADKTWSDIVGSVFGHFPPSKRFNGAKLQLSWFDTFIPKKLDDNSSDEHMRQYSRPYL